jgi:hypothetical protein
MSRYVWSFLILPLLFSIGFTSENGYSQDRKKRTKKNKLSEKEDLKIEKEIENLRKDYAFYKQGVSSLNKIVSYMVKRGKRNERVALEKKIAGETKKAKIKDIIERAKLLILLEQRLKKYKNKPDSLWTPELLWRTAVLYHEIAEERSLWVENEDENTGKILSYEEEYQAILNSAYKLSKGAIRPADTSLGINYYRKKSEANLRMLISKFPKFRAIGSAFHLLARVYEKPPFSDNDSEKMKPAKVSLGAVCPNWGYKPFSHKFKDALVAKGSSMLTATSMVDYKKWEITDFPSKLPFDPFASCKPVNGSVEFIGTAWATLGKFLATQMLEFKKLDPNLTEEEATNIKLFNLNLTKWAALSAYKRALGPENMTLSTRGYIVYFAGLMLYQNELNQALAMKLFDRVISMGQEDDKNSPHEAAIKYVGFLLQEDRINEETGDTDYSWKAPYPINCKDKCPVKKLVSFYDKKKSKNYIKRIWLGTADFFYGLEDKKRYQRSDEDLLYAYSLYDYIFRKMDVEGGWKYNPKKPYIFWQMRGIILSEITKYNDLLAQVKARSDINTINGKIKFWKKKKRDLYAFAPNVVFKSSEIEIFLTEHQKFLLKNRVKKIKIDTISLKELRTEIINIKSFTLMSTGEVLADTAKDFYYRMKKASGAEKNRLKKKARHAFDKAVAYFNRIIKDYPNSIFQYAAMVRILNFYCELPVSRESKDGKTSAVTPQYFLIDIAANQKAKLAVIYDALNWGRKVRDSHLGSQWKQNAAVVLNFIYVDRLSFKDPGYPFDIKNDKSPKVSYVKKDLPTKYKYYIEDAKIYMKMYPKDKNSPIFLYKIARIYLHYHHIDKAREIYRLILKKYCSHETAYVASYDMFLTYKYQEVTPENANSFNVERKNAIKELESKKCGGDEKHRELMDMIAKLELNELVKKTRDVFSEAGKAKANKKNDPEKWQKALVLYNHLLKKMESRKVANKELKAFHDNLFGIYWRIYECKIELGNFQGAIKTLETIRKKPELSTIADKKGYKENILIRLAEAYTKSFDYKQSILMWKELTRTGPRGTWRILKKSKIKMATESQYRLMAEEKIFKIYRSRGRKSYKQTYKQGEKLIAQFRTRKRLFKKIYTVNESTAYKELGKVMGLEESKVIKYYILGWTCKSGTCKVTVTDKSIFYKEILFNMALGKAFEKQAGETELNNALDQIREMESTYNSYIPLSRIFKPSANDTYITSPAYEGMWKTRLNLIYRKATIWKKIMVKNRRNYDKMAKARKKYREQLSSYRELYEKHLKATPVLNSGYAVISYGEALIDSVQDKYAKVKNPFKSEKTIAITTYEDAQLSLVSLQKRVQGKGADLQEKVKKIQEKMTKRQGEYIADVKLYIEALQKIQGHQNGSAKLANKDLLKFYNRFKKYQKKYPKFLGELGKIGVNKAIAALIGRQKDMIKMTKQLEKLSKGWSKSLPETTKAFFKVFIPKAKKALKSVEKVYSGMNLPVLKGIRTTITNLEKVYKTKKEITFADLSQLISPLATLSLLSVMLDGNNTLAITYGTGQAIEARANSYDWYKEQKGYLRKQVSKIKANFLALKMNLLIQGIKIFTKAPYTKKLAQAELDEDKAKMMAQAGCSLKREKDNLNCFFKYKRKLYHKRSYSIKVNGASKDVVLVPLDKLVDEYNNTFKKLFSIMKKEKVTSPIITKAYNAYSKFNRSGGKIAPIVEPKIELISY